MQSENKWRQITILSELNDCSREEIAELVADIPIEDGSDEAPTPKVFKHRDSAEIRKQYYRDFSSRLRTQIADKGYRPYKFSEECNIPNSSMASYLKGECLPDIFAILKMAKVLQISVDALLGVDEIWK